ncbi:hypothetical protein [Lysobacter sp. Root96]|uniref:hypothetical protein n=1 Tax=Lysobacter sp. Root96 TaxID=1736612 RepID=UPI0006F8A36D|nr:hypothetical protein [Lysobacter sp. Root96]KRD71426.1 hypothetical protein ASE45_06345 [Lysobacter sp. Root96]
MNATEAKAAFPSEAALCDCFIDSIRRLGGWTIYPETAGFDILAVYDSTGHQLGVEAKQTLNAKVADQILPDHYMGYGEGGVEGPDFRAVIVPHISEASAGIAKMLGILGVQVWTPEANYSRDPTFDRALDKHYTGSKPDRRMYDSSAGPLMDWDMAWHDWNPPKRCHLPEIVPMVRAGVPAPIQLTPWKIGALRVLALLELDGYVTAKSVRDCGIDARRFCSTDGWLQSLGGGRWGRGTVPAFDQQHPEAYAEVLAKARAERSKAA